MAELTISKANPIHFRIETANAGGVNENGTFPDNYLYHEIAEYYNCGQMMPSMDNIWFQKYKCDDVTDVQVKFDGTGLTGANITLKVYDENDNIVDEILPTTPYVGAATYHNFNIDWANFDCGGCYHLKLYRNDLDTGVPVNWGDNGTFEDSTDWSDNWVTGGGNTKLQSTIVFQAGAASASIVAPNPATATEGLVFQTGSTTIFTFQANTMYKISMYVYDDNTLPFTQDGHQLRIDVNGLTDGQILQENTIIPSVAGRNAWHEISTIFVTGTDITGRFDIVHETIGGVQTAPQAQGIMFTDTHTLTKGTQIHEATSETIELLSDPRCTVLVEYYGDNPQMGIYCAEVDYPARYRYREDIRIAKWIYEDEDFDVYRESDATFQKVAANPDKVYTFESGLVAPYMAEIIGLSTLFDNVNVDSLAYARKDGNYEPDWNDKGTACHVNFDMKLSGYTYNKSLCS